MKVTINMKQLYMAADFILTHNEYASSWEEKTIPAMANRMHRDIMQYAEKNAKIVAAGQVTDQFINYMSTGGYTIIFNLESTTDETTHDLIDISVLVDPAVSVEYDESDLVTTEL